MKLIFGFLSTLALTVASIGSCEIASALGPSVSGGPSAAPRAIVVQAWAVKGSFDEVGFQTALTLAGQQVAANRVVAFSQRDEAQASDRKVLCLEYRHFDEYQTAADEFRAALANSPSLEVVANGICP